MTESARRLPRFRRAPELLPNRQITELDLDLIEILNRFHILPSILILALSSAHPVTVYTHLQTLWHRGLISRFFFSRLGTGEAYHYLNNPKVVDLLVSHDRDTSGFDRALIRRRRERPYSDINHPELGEEMEGRRLFLKHEVIISRFHAILELADLIGRDLRRTEVKETLIAFIFKRQVLEGTLTYECCLLGAGLAELHGPEIAWSLWSN